MLGYLRAIRLDHPAPQPMRSAAACRRRLPPGLARACSSHRPGNTNLPIGAFAFADVRTVERQDGTCPEGARGDPATKRRREAPPSAQLLSQQVVPPEPHYEQLALG
jgi:hypothetical protein